MPWDNILYDAILWFAVVYGTAWTVYRHEARRAARRRQRPPAEPARHVRLAPADVDPNGRVHKLGVDREVAS